MGWNSAGDIFETVADSLLSAGAYGSTIERVCGDLIDHLSAQDWDTQGESLSRYVSHGHHNAGYIVTAFVKAGHEPEWCDSYRVWAGASRAVCSKYKGHHGKHTVTEDIPEWDDET